MARGGGYFKAIIEEQDYNSTVYTTWVSAESKQQAIVMAAALAGQEKARREFERNPRHGVMVEGLMVPTIRLEIADINDYFNKRDMVEVTDINTPRDGA